jgi:ribonucleoside-triphosphate reductase
LFGANPLTGSIGVVTINLPRIGYLSANKREFYANLKEKIQIAVESLSIKRKILEKFTDNNLYPYSKFYLREIKKNSGHYWKNHFSTIGIIGMNEACLNFLSDDLTTDRGQEFAIEIMDYMRDLMAEIQKETGEIYNLEATPAEGTSHRLSLLDKKKYPDIISANEDDVRRGAAPYYTNSSQLPVNYSDDIFETLRLQDTLQTKYTGGTVLHIFLGEQVSDTTAVKGLIRKVAENFRLPYFTLSPTFSICPSHGYLDGEQKSCSICHQETEVYSRVVGYLRPIKQWNSGKQAEYGDRKTFKVAKDADEGRQMTEVGSRKTGAAEWGSWNSEFGMGNAASGLSEL